MKLGVVTCRGWGARVPRVLVACAAGFAVAATAAAQEPVRLETLGNGLRVLLAPDSLAQAVSVGLWFEAGVRWEPEGRSGLTHVLGRLELRGTPEVRERMARIEAAGGVPNFNIFADAAGSTLLVPPDALDAALELQAGRLAGIPATEAALREQARLVREDRARRIDPSPVGRGLERLYACAFAGHPYARPAIGLDADVARITAADAAAFARRRMDPAHALLVVSGRFDAARVMESIRRGAGAVRAVASRARDAVPPPPRTVPRASLGAGDGPKILLAGWRLSGRGDADAAAALVLSRLLFGAGGRVERRVPAAEGPVVQAQGDLDVRRDASLLHTVAVVSESADTSMAESLLLDVIESAATEPPAPGELERARRQAEAALLFPAQGAQGRGQALALAQMVGGRWAAWQAEVEAVRRVTAEDVTRVAGAHLVPAARSIVWVRTPARGESP